MFKLTVVAVAVLLLGVLHLQYTLAASPSPRNGMAGSRGGGGLVFGRGRGSVGGVWRGRHGGGGGMWGQRQGSIGGMWRGSGMLRDRQEMGGDMLVGQYMPGMWLGGDGDW